MYQIRPGMCVNMHLKVYKKSLIPDPSGWFPRYEILVGDKFGEARMTVSDEQLPLMKVGSMITVENAGAKNIGSHLHIVVDNWTKVTEMQRVVARPPFLSSFNISATILSYRVFKFEAEPFLKRLSKSCTDYFDSHWPYLNEFLSDAPPLDTRKIFFGPADVLMRFKSLQEKEIESIYRE